MQVIGRGAGARALQERLADVSGPDIVWGRNGVDGYTQLQRFAAAGIPCPEFTTNSNLAAGQWVDEYTGIWPNVWGRKFHHARGNDIIAYDPLNMSRKRRRDFWDRDFWVKVIPNIAFELRIHVWDGRAFRTGVKQRVGNPVNPRSRIANLPVRNDRNGWKLRYGQEALNAVPEAQRRAARDVAKQAVAACNYLYGAVDTYITADGVVGVFEVNTAPALGDFTTEAYVTTITEWAARQDITS